MTFTLGIFDLYTYTVPGAAMVGFLAYLGVRLELVDPRTVTSLPGLALLLIAAGLSFVLGHLLYALGTMLDRFGPLARWDHGDARRTFLAGAGRRGAPVRDGAADSRTVLLDSRHRRAVVAFPTGGY